VITSRVTFSIQAMIGSIGFCQRPPTCFLCLSSGNAFWCISCPLDKGVFSFFFFFFWYIERVRSLCFAGPLGVPCFFYLEFQACLQIFFEPI